MTGFASRALLHNAAGESRFTLLVSLHRAWSVCHCCAFLAREHVLGSQGKAPHAHEASAGARRSSQSRGLSALWTPVQERLSTHMILMLGILSASS